jgi:hypothetical protein
MEEKGNGNETNQKYSAKREKGSRTKRTHKTP